VNLRKFVAATVFWKRLALISVVVTAVSVVVLGCCRNLGLSGVRDVSIKEVVSDPRSFDGVHARLHGYVADASYMFGPKYVLRDVDD
jgi:hypothetical protein